MNMSGLTRIPFAACATGVSLMGVTSPSRKVVMNLLSKRQRGSNLIIMDLVL